MASVMAAPHFVQHLRADRKKTLASPACVKKPDRTQLRFNQNAQKLRNAGFDSCIS
ncbi:hypothetical protein CEV32_4854 [Brucella rhizosphaerae]|uniref:Uncharacterized protein n=1 Tax=Brucella rhizosphaerae TaxID=571254 RepID=A0A256FLC6_9HYPH|nr:hypothetical protein CEV32_4854 [Brucella rhizosphaerae]